MAHLTLVGLSEDRTRLLLVGDDGAEFTLDVDNALRSALRGEQPRPGHLETRMDSALRPRDIQARIRSGETPEAVAEAANSSVDKIMPYAAPVLAERAHVAQRAQRSSVRRRAGESTGSLGGGRTLEEAVNQHLRSLDTDPSGVEWDASRREDGRWTLTGLFETPDRTGVATFTFDMPGNYVTIDDDDARWLVGDTKATRAATQEAAPEAPMESSGQRRLSAVRNPAPLGDDAIQLVTPPTEDTTPEFLRERPDPTPAQAPAATTPEPAPARSETPEEPTSAPEEPPAADAPRKAARKRRASVPSWDEIMFGGGSGE